ncbi:MAG TPA: hypothetical protein VGC42_04210 [Kofleriaceae bacterium]
MQRALAAVLLAAASACGSAGQATGVVDASAGRDATDGPDGASCAPPLTMCGDRCTNLANDPASCGACDHACGCGSTTCTAGMCDAHVLAAQQSAPVALAFNADQLYWGNDGDSTVMTMPADGSVAARPLFTGRTAVRGFAFDAARVYFTRNVFNIVESATQAGAGAGNFTNQQENGAAGIVTDGTNVFWANGAATGVNPQAIRRAANGAPVATPSTLASAQAGADAIALDATSVYWTTSDPVNGAIRKVAKLGTGNAVVQLIAKQARPHSLAVAGGFVYWANQGDGTPRTGSINRMPITGGAPTTLAQRLGQPMALAVNADAVFWTDAVDGTVSRVPLAGGAPPQVLVAGEAAPGGLALSPTCLYFADQATSATGSIRAHDLR